MKEKMGSAVFLAEVIIDICFFAISCAIIIQVFATSAAKADQSRDITWAGIEAQSIAEQIKALPYDFISSDHVSFYYDSTYAKLTSDVTESAYAAEIDIKRTQKEHGLMVQYTIVMKKQDSHIFELTSSKYFPREVI